MIEVLECIENELEESKFGFVGICFLVMLLCGVSYNVPILTYNLW